MEGFDVMFSGKSVYVSRRLMAIKPMTAFNLFLVCEKRIITPNEEIKTLPTFLHDIVFGHNMLALVMVVVYHE